MVRAWYKRGAVFYSLTRRLVMQDGTRVRDVDTGRVGTVQIGWATGAFSIVWDDDPGVAEHYYEGELEVIGGGGA